MGKRITSLCVVALLAVLLVTPARADLLYDNGPPGVPTTAYNIGYVVSVSDSFLLTSASDLTQATIAVVVPTTVVPIWTTWSIGPVPFSAADGTASDVPLANVLISTAITSSTFVSPADLYESTFTLTASLGPGTYWLTLENTLASQDYFAATGWVENDGQSQAQQEWLGVIGSESFQLYGNAAAVPEPSTMLLMGSGLLGLWRFRRKFRK